MATSHDQQRDMAAAIDTFVNQLALVQTLSGLLTAYYLLLTTYYLLLTTYYLLLTTYYLLLTLGSKAIVGLGGAELPSPCERSLEKLA